MDLLKERPAETGTLGAALAVLVAYALGVDNEAVIAALTVVLGVVPGVITGIVSRRKPTHSNLIVPPE